MPNQFHILDTAGSFNIRKFGFNGDIDSGSVPEDIWDAGGEYPFPASAQATTIVSSSSSDIVAGIGAQQVTVQGLDADLKEISEVVTLNGTTPVALANNYFRVFRAFVVASGLNNTNIGDIQVLHSPTVIAQISAGNGQTEMAIFTISEDPNIAYITNFFASVGRQGTVNCELELQTNDNGAGWRVRSHLSLNAQGTGTIEVPFRVPINVSPGTDIRVRCTEISANNCSVAASFTVTDSPT